MWQGKAAHGFLPAASPKALTRISREIRRLDASPPLAKIPDRAAQMYNRAPRLDHLLQPLLQDAVASDLKRIDAYVIRWARRKFKADAPPDQRARDGSHGYAVPTQHSLPIGGYVMATAEHREPV